MDTSRINLLLDFNLLLDNNLSLDAWLILYTLNEKSSILEEYTKNCGPISTKHFLSLRDKGYIVLRDENKISLTNMYITEKGKLLLINNNEDNNKVFERLFLELRNTYPKKVPADNGTFRALHGDLNRCKKLYKKILTNKDNNIDIELHKKILQSIEKQVYDYTLGKRLPFLQALVTYLHQSNYIQYFDVNIDIKEVKIKGDDI